MASTCETCRHRRPGTDAGTWHICSLELPPWVPAPKPWIVDQGTGEAWPNRQRQVQPLDTCEFWNLDKGDASRLEYDFTQGKRGAVA